MLKLNLGKIEIIIISAVFLIISFLVISNHLPNSGSDPYGTTVISQNILVNRTLTLKGKYADFFKLPGGNLRYQVTNISGKIEYNYPLGTPVLSLPLVFIANKLGLNALKNGLKIQEIIVFIVIFFVLLVTYTISRIFLSKSISSAISVLTILGTIIGPAIGTGLWSLDMEVLLIGVTFLLLIAADLNKSINSLILGIILFLGYFVRPSFALIIIFVFLYLLANNRKAFLISAITSFLCLVLFMLISFHYYGSYLPLYYQRFRLFSIKNAKTAVIGLLFSPSRSIFIYSPIIILPVFYIILRLKSYCSNFILNNKANNTNKTQFSFKFNSILKKVYPGLFYTGIFIMISLFLMNVFWPYWWGGWSYCPRILTDLTYIGVIITVIVIGNSHKQYEKERKKWVNFAIILFIAGLFINLRGIYYVHSTILWNAYPNVNFYPESVFDWNYPQFLLLNKNTLQKKCLSESREYKIKNKFPNYICPNPPEEYYLKYFSIIYLNSIKFLKNNNDKLSELYPKYLEDRGYIPKSFGYATGKDNNWTNSGGWIGGWNCHSGNGKCFGVGIVGNINNLKPIIIKYGTEATQIFFPYPKVYNANNSKDSGQLVMIFQSK